MHFFIDGYNVLFRISSVLDDFAASREQIIQDLNRKALRLKMDFTIVFDAHDRPGEAYRTHYNHLEILFSGEGETADDLILKMLRRDSSNCTVVTSDNQLAWKARVLGAKTESVDAFLIKLNKRYLNALKKVKKEKSFPIIPPKESPKEPLRVNATVDECFDYYLAIFEKNVPKQEPEKSEPKKVLENDLDRWLRIFEERLKKYGE